MVRPSSTTFQGLVPEELETVYQLSCPTTVKKKMVHFTNAHSPSTILPTGNRFGALALANPLRIKV